MVHGYTAWYIMTTECTCDDAGDAGQNCTQSCIQLQAEVPGIINGFTVHMCIYNKQYLKASSAIWFRFRSGSD